MEKNKESKILKLKNNTGLATKSLIKMLIWLINKIRSKEKRIMGTEKFLNKMLKIYKKNIEPLLNEVSELDLKIIIILTQVTETHNFSKKNIDLLSEIICDKIERILFSRKPDENLIKLYDKWNSISYQEKINLENLELKNQFETFLKEVFDLDLILSDGKFNEIKTKMENLGTKDINGLEKINSPELIELLNIIGLSQFNNTDLNTELKNKIDENYLVLVNFIEDKFGNMDNPDLTLKEEYQTKASQAKNDSNFELLSKITFDWIVYESTDKAYLTDEKVSSFISFLKHYNYFLVLQLNQIDDDPKYSAIFDIANLSEDTALKEIKYQKRTLMEEIRIYESVLNTFNESEDLKSVILAIIEDYIKMKESEIIDNFFDIIENT
jgi:hypothetical protein